MKNKISHEDLCNMIANNYNGQTSPQVVDKYLRAIYKTILRQLELNQKIYFKNFGTFEVKERKSGERLINNPKKNKMEIFYVKPRLSISFKASSKFDYCVNENNFTLIRGDTTKQYDRQKNKRYKYKKYGDIADLLNRANSRRKDNG